MTGRVEVLTDSNLSSSNIVNRYQSLEVGEENSQSAWGRHFVGESVYAIHAPEKPSRIFYVSIGFDTLQEMITGRPHPHIMVPRGVCQDHFL